MTPRLPPLREQVRRTPVRREPCSRSNDLTGHVLDTRCTECLGACPGNGLGIK
jgi:hypothetical protein